jgi:drug/metabolite transporter (DMT)-like permease
MAYTPTTAPLLMWLTPALLALLLYGLGQGFVKMWITEVPPARFCLYFACARAIVMGCYYFANPHTSLFEAGGQHVFAIGVLAYLLDGTGWIMYFLSIIAGPITIVGTLSAAYPALTILFAHWFLGETLAPLQYGAVALVIGGCIGLAYQPADAANKTTGRAWIPLAFSALVLWGSAQTIVKYDYRLGATDANMALYSMIGALLTLGVYGLWKGRAGTHSVIEWTRSFLPMGMMASGDLGVLIASRYGKLSIVSPLTGAYPIVTLAFAALGRAVDSLRRNPGKILLMLGLAALTAAVIMAPYLFEYQRLHQITGFERTIYDAEQYAASWTDYLSTGSRIHHALWSYRFFDLSRSATFPGLAGLALACLALVWPESRRDPRVHMCLVAAAGCAAVSFAPHASFKRARASVALPGRSAGSGAKRSSIHPASPAGKPRGSAGRVRRPSRTADMNPATSFPFTANGGLPCTAS